MNRILTILCLCIVWAGPLYPTAWASDEIPHIEIEKNGDPVTTCSIGSCNGDRSHSGWGVGHDVDSRSKNVSVVAGYSRSFSGSRSGRRSTRAGRCLTRGCSGRPAQHGDRETPDASHDMGYKLESKAYESLEEIREEHQREFRETRDRAGGVSSANRQLSKNIRGALRTAAAAHNEVAQKVEDIPVPEVDPTEDDDPTSTPNPHKTSRHSPYWQKVDGISGYARHAREELADWDTPDKDLRTKALDTADFNIKAADTAYAGKDVELGNAFYDAAEALVDIALSSLPITGNMIAMYEAVLGTNPISGTSLSDIERTLALAGAIFPGGGALVKGVARVMKKVGGKYATGIISSIAGADLDFLKMGAKGSVDVIGDISGRALEGWRKVWGSLDTVKHVVVGDLAVNVNSKIISLKSGLHTKSGLKRFVAMRKAAGDSVTIKDVMSFPSKPLANGVVLRQELPNKVVRVQLPKGAWVNAEARKNSSARDGAGKVIQGVKTLWPENMSIGKITAATKEVIRQNAGKTGMIHGEYSGIKIAVIVDEATGKVLTSFPTWRQ